MRQLKQPSADSMRRAILCNPFSLCGLKLSPFFGTAMAKGKRQLVSRNPT
jgi:hypothetical protein